MEVPMPNMLAPGLENCQSSELIELSSINKQQIAQRKRRLKESMLKECRTKRSKSQVINLDNDFHINKRQKSQRERRLKESFLKDSQQNIMLQKDREPIQAVNIENDIMELNTRQQGQRKRRRREQLEKKSKYCQTTISEENQQSPIVSKRKFSKRARREQESMERTAYSYTMDGINIVMSTLDKENTMSNVQYQPFLDVMDGISYGKSYSRRDQILERVEGKKPIIDDDKIPIFFGSSSTGNGNRCREYKVIREDLVNISVKNYPGNQMLGSRYIVDGKLGKYVWLTYKEVYDIVMRIVYPSAVAVLRR